MVVEDRPAGRIRIARCNMDESTVVKEVRACVRACVSAFAGLRRTPGRVLMVDMVDAPA